MQKAEAPIAKHLGLQVVGLTLELGDDVDDPIAWAVACLQDESAAERQKQRPPSN